jgi:hypothetical protein
MSRIRTDGPLFIMLVTEKHTFNNTIISYIHNLIMKRIIIFLSWSLTLILPQESIYYPAQPYSNLTTHPPLIVMGYHNSHLLDSNFVSFFTLTFFHSFSSFLSYNLFWYHPLYMHTDIIPTAYGGSYDVCMALLVNNVNYGAVDKNQRSASDIAKFKGA